MQRPVVIVASELIMGIAVNGMHFTGMSAMSVHEHERSGSLSGATVSSLLIPIGLAVVFAVMGLIYALMAPPQRPGPRRCGVPGGSVGGKGGRTRPSAPERQFGPMTVAGSSSSARSTARAALRPGRPLTLPPGWLVEPVRKRPSIEVP